MAAIKCNTARNVYLTGIVFVILVIMCSSSPSCQGQEQPQVAPGHPPIPHGMVQAEQTQVVARLPPPENPEPPVPVPWIPEPRPPSFPRSVLHPEQPQVVARLPPEKPEPPVPVPWIPEPRPPSIPHSVLHQEQPQRARLPPPDKPEPPVPVPSIPVPCPPPTAHGVLQQERKSATCYPTNNRLSSTGCEQMCKENGFKRKYSYYIERQLAKWECCCPH